jgi:membrane protein required for colicin V production
MSIIDILIIAVITLFVYRGAKNGMVNELLGFTGLVLALLSALRLGSPVGRFLAPKLKIIPEQIEGIFGFFVVFGFVLIGFSVLMNFFQKAFDKELQGKVNRFVGAVFGFAKGLFFVSVLTLGLYVLPLEKQLKRAEQDSVLFSHMTYFAQVIASATFKAVPQLKPPIQKAAEKLDNQSGPSSQ